MSGKCQGCCYSPIPTFSPDCSQLESEEFAEDLTGVGGCPGEDSVREESDAVDAGGDAGEYLQPGGRTLGCRGARQEDQGLRLRTLLPPRRRSACSQRHQQYVWLSICLSLSVSVF